MKLQKEKNLIVISFVERMTNQDLTLIANSLLHYIHKLIKEY